MSTYPEPLATLLNPALSLTEAFRALQAQGWNLGGGGWAPDQIPPEAPATLKDWWLAPQPANWSQLIGAGVPQVISPEVWADHFPGDKVLAKTDRGWHSFLLEPDEQVFACHLPQPRILGEDDVYRIDDAFILTGPTPLRVWFACHALVEYVEGSGWMANVREAQRAEVLTKFTPLDLPAWCWPRYPTHFYAAPGVLAMLSPDPWTEWVLALGAQTWEALLPFWDLSEYPPPG